MEGTQNGCSSCAKGEHRGHEKDKGVVVELSGGVFPINAFGVGESVRECSFPDRFEAGVDALFRISRPHETIVGCV